VPVEDAPEKLRELANARSYLLGREAGIMRGACQVRPCTPAYRAAVELLIAAGADEDGLAHWVEVGRQRASAPQHGI
jgi:hypothetical protein